MNHFFTAPELVGDGRVRLVGPEAHHAARVLRMKVGETISVADGSGRVVDAVVTKASGEQVDARVILERRRSPAVPALMLWQGVARRERMDLVVQKAVEVGARRIEPFVAERTLARWDEAKRARVVDRWSAIALSAAKQSRSPWLTEVGPITEGPPAAPSGLVIVLHEEAEVPFRKALPPAPPAHLVVVVGPEGGLTDEEVERLTDGGGVAVTLGERILRTETAGPVALALAAYSYGLLG